MFADADSTEIVIGFVSGNLHKRTKNFTNKELSFEYKKQLSSTFGYLVDDTLSLEPQYSLQTSPGHNNMGADGQSQPLGQKMASANFGYVVRLRQVS